MKKIKARKELQKDHKKVSARASEYLRIFAKPAQTSNFWGNLTKLNLFLLGMSFGMGLAVVIFIECYLLFLFD